MLFRLLLALLMLTGPLPVGSCTCQASDTQKTEAPELISPATPPTPTTGHRCQHHHGSSDDAISSISSWDHCDACSALSHSHDSDRHRPDHDRSCPAVTARAVPQAVQGPAIDVSLTAAPAMLDWTGLALADHVKPSAHHLRRPAKAEVPLFLSILSIRI